MRRPLAALLLGAVSLAALVPVAAGADQLPKLPFGGPRKPVLKLACDVIRHDGAPAVSCSWSTPPAPAATAPAEADEMAARDVARPAPYVYRLGRVGRGGRTVVYKGGDTNFVDTTVEPGRKYGYKVQAFDADSRRPVAGSRMVRVSVPKVPAARPFEPKDPGTPAEPACRNSASETVAAKCRPADPAPKPEPAPRPKPAPQAEPKPVPEPRPKPEPQPAPKRLPTPEPTSEPLPAPKPTPTTEPRPAPVPDPKPVPVIARMKLACSPQRSDVSTSTADRTTFAPSGDPVVVCEWAAPSDLKVAGYQLWRAERPEGTKQVIFRSADPEEMGTGRHVDRAVSAGHSYAYVVKAFNANGRVIAQSDVVTISFPATTTTDAAA